MVLLLLGLSERKISVTWDHQPTSRISLSPPLLPLPQPPSGAASKSQSPLRRAAPTLPPRCRAGSSDVQFRIRVPSRSRAQGRGASSCPRPSHPAAAAASATRRTACCRLASRAPLWRWAPQTRAIAGCRASLFRAPRSRSSAAGRCLPCWGASGGGSYVQRHLGTAPPRTAHQRGAVVRAAEEAHPYLPQGAGHPSVFKFALR